MKYLILFMLLTQTAFALPILGEYKACTDKDGEYIDAYVHLVDFGEEELGFQIAIWPRMSSMIIKIDQSLQVTQERISGYQFEYQAQYQNDQLKLNFSSSNVAKLIGFDKEYSVYYNNNIIELSFDGQDLICSKDI
jgi:hypothetical protein